MKKKGLTLVNFRDLGGIKTADGGVIKRGKLYRTAIFEPITDEDNALIASINPDTVVDLRSPQEVVEHPDRLAKNVKYVSAPVFADKRFELLIPTKEMQGNMFRATNEQMQGLWALMRDSYSYMPYSPSYAKLFEALHSGDTVAFHCTAGKDRTGVGAMLVELALGCDKATALQDYLRSNEEREASVKRLEFGVRLLPMSKCKKDFACYAMRVHEELFDNAYNAIFSRYATIQDFYKAVFGISSAELDKWKEFYLD